MRVFLLKCSLENLYNENMDDTTRIAIENQKKLDNNQRRAYNVRVNGEEHSASSRNGVAQIHFPVDGQLMQISQLAFKLIINDGVRSGGSVEPSEDPTKNWAYGVNTYKTYEEWLARYPVGSRVDVDGFLGCQCWDYASAFWRAQCNRNLLTGSLGYAYECWTVSRAANQGSEFDLVYLWQDIQPGDWVVWGTSGAGHIAMATACAYTSTAVISFRDQNGPQGLQVGANMYGPDLGNGNRFLGAFRFKNWKTPGCGTLG